MKTCYNCKQSLPLEAFNKNKSRKDGLATWCRECWKVYYRENYYQRGNEKARLLANNKRDQKRRVELIRTLKDVPCMDCGLKYPYYVMDFDHRDPSQKSFNIGNHIYTCSMKQLLAEVAKCDIVCSNCHRERTYGVIA